MNGLSAPSLLLPAVLLAVAPDTAGRAPISTPACMPTGASDALHSSPPGGDDASSSREAVPAESGETLRAVTRTGILSVADFGARGDGITDDSRAIQAAIDAAQVASGRLVFPPGKYLVRTGLRVTSAVTLQGANAAGDSEARIGSQIVADGPIVALTIDCARADGPGISDLRFAGSARSAGAVWVRHGLGTRLSNVRISQFSEGYAIQLGDVRSDVFWTYIDNIKVDRCLDGIVTVPNAHYVGNTVVRGGSLDGTGLRGIGVALRMANGDFNRFRDISIEGFSLGMLLSASDTDVSAYFEGMPVAVDVRGRRNHIHHSLFIANGVGVTLANAIRASDVEGTSIRDNGWKNVPKNGTYIREHAEGDPEVVIDEPYLDTAGPASAPRSVLPRIEVRAPAGKDALVLRKGARVRFGGPPEAFISSGDTGLVAGGRLSTSGGLSAGSTEGRLQPGQLFMGSGPPAQEAGAVGDFYMRTDTPEVAHQRLYVKTNLGLWLGIL
jgi:hypothetical protein